MNGHHLLAAFSVLLSLVSVSYGGTCQATPSPAGSVSSTKQSANLREVALKPITRLVEKQRGSETPRFRGDTVIISRVVFDVSVSPSRVDSFGGATPNPSWQAHTFNGITFYVIPLGQ